MKNLPLYLIGSYMFIAILTFGIAYNKDYEHAAGTCPIWCSKADEDFRNGGRAILDAMLWPLYISTEAFTFMRKE